MSNYYKLKTDPHGNPKKGIHSNQRLVLYILCHVHSFQGTLNIPNL